MSVTTSKTKHIDELHFEHQLWSSEVKFFIDELKIYNKRLAEVAAANTGADVRKQIEQFQNKFIVQKEQLDILNHQINEHENWLARYADEHPVAVDHTQFADHKQMHDKMDVFRKLYAELKKDFNKFLSERL